MFNLEIRLSGTVGQLKAASDILNNDSLCLLLFYWVRNYKKQIQGMNDSNLLTKPYTIANKNSYQNPIFSIISYISRIARSIQKKK